MLTVPEVVERIVTHAPFLEEGLCGGLLNLSAVARQIRPDVESRTAHKVSEAAIVMGLRRLAVRLRKRTRPLGNVLRNIGDLTLRSDLVEFTFQTSSTILDRKRQLLDAMVKRRGTFVAITQGISEVTLIVSRSRRSATLCRLPPYWGIRLSASVTSAPSVSSRRARFEPMKPRPPVMSTRRRVNSMVNAPP